MTQAETQFLRNSIRSNLAVRADYQTGVLVLCLTRSARFVDYFLLWKKCSVSRGVEMTVHLFLLL